MEEMDKLYGGVVVKVMMILDFIRDQRIAPNLTEIAGAVNVTKGTASKIMHTMQELDLAVKDNVTGRYRIGLRLVSYGQKALDDFSIKTELQPYLDQLQHEIGETIHVGVEQNGHVVYIIKREARDLVALQSRVGNRVGMYSSAMGKALLAQKKNTDIQKYLESITLVKHTKNTITSKRRFMDEIVEIRDRGISYDREEFEIGVCSAAIALVGHGQVYGALSISVPTYRLTDEKKQQIDQALLQLKKKLQEIL